MSDTDLKEKEEAIDPADFENEFGSSFTNDERSRLDDLSNQVGLYKGGGDASEKLKFKISGKQAATAGGVTSLLVGGSFGVLTIVSGPLQFIHIAKLLNRFHFASVENNGNSRMLKVYKYSKNLKNGTFENTRLGAVGNRVAGKIDASLAEIGLKKEYTGTLASYDGMTLDAIKFSENAENGADFKRIGPEEFVAKFKEKFNIDITPINDANGNPSGSFKIPPEEGMFAYFKNRSVNKMVVAETGTDGVGGVISSRIMGKRDGVTWHPIKRADNYLTGKIDEAFTRWLAKMKERIKNGSDNLDVTATGEKTTDANGKPIENPTNADGAAAVDSAAKDASQAVDSGSTSSEGILANFTHSPVGKLSMGGVALVGLVCAAHGLAMAADALKHDFVILPLIRTGMQAISLGNQVMSGQDLDMTQLGYFAKELNDPNSGSWAAAKSIQAENGQPQTGPDIPDEANIKNVQNGTAFSQLLNKIPGIGVVCDAVGSPIGQAVSFAVSLTTPIATIITTGLMQTQQAKDALAGIVKWLAGSPIPSFVLGPTYGNYINYGARLASNNTKAALGGVKLTPGQSAELKNFQNQQTMDTIASESFFQRIFDPVSPDSVVAKAIDVAPTSVSQGVAMMTAKLTNPFSMIGGRFWGTFTQKVSAEASATYDYGFPEVGYSLSDMNNSTYDNPYDNGKAAVATLNIPCVINGQPNHPCGQDYINEAQHCYGVLMSPDGNIDSGLSYKLDVLAKGYDDHTQYGLYCSDPSTVWSQIRFYIMDLKTTESMDCYYGTPQSCNSVGFDGAAAGSQ